MASPRPLHDAYVRRQVVAPPCIHSNAWVCACASRHAHIQQTFASVCVNNSQCELKSSACAGLRLCMHACPHMHARMRLWVRVRTQLTRDVPVRERPATLSLRQAPSSCNGKAVCCASKPGLVRSLGQTGAARSVFVRVCHIVSVGSESVSIRPAYVKHRPSPILPRQWIGTAPKLCRYCTDNAAKLRRRCTDSVPMLYRQCTDPAPTLHQRCKRLCLLV